MIQDLMAVFPLVVGVNASDLHLTAGVPPVLRLDSSLWRLTDLADHGSESVSAQVKEFLTQHPACAEPLPAELLTELVDHLLDKPDLKRRFLEKGSADIPYSVPGVSRFRVNVYRQRGSAALVARNLADKVPPMKDLFSCQSGLVETMISLTRLARGLVLVTGPTGSGKSTSMASMISFMIKESPRHVLTLENPIEYQIPHGRGLVNQRELGDDVDSFAEGLRAALREDPDVIVVGEMRDTETIASALTAAETGHLVLSTLHTRTAVETVSRVVDVFPSGQQDQIRTQLSGSLQAVLSQQLMPRKGGSGMVAAVEVLMSTHAVKSMIRDNRLQEIPSFIQTGREAGMIPMDKALAGLVKNGLVDFDVALERSVDPKLFTSYAGGAPGSSPKEGSVRPRQGLNPF